MNSVMDQFKAKLSENGIRYDSILRDQFVKKHELLEVIDQYDGIICSDDELDAEVLQKGKKLKVISKWGVGIDSIDQVEAKKLGIKVCNSPGAFSEACANITMGMIISLARQMVVANDSMKSGHWEKFQGISLRGKKLGLIGFGNIGKEVAKRAHAFDMELYCNDLNQVPADLVTLYNLKVVEKDFIYKNCDFISLHVPLSKDTFHLISKREFELMKSEAYVINTSRGPVIEEKALLWALVNKKIAGAGLDVFEFEPVEAVNPLLKFPNCLMSAHNSYNTREAVDYVHQNTINNLIRGLNG